MYAVTQALTHHPVHWIMLVPVLGMLFFMGIFPAVWIGFRSPDSVFKKGNGGR